MALANTVAKPLYTTYTYICTIYIPIIQPPHPTRPEQETQPTRPDPTYFLAGGSELVGTHVPENSAL